jgi:fatty acid desaturase
LTAAASKIHLGRYGTSWLTLLPLSLGRGAAMLLVESVTHLSFHGAVAGQRITDASLGHLHSFEFEQLGLMGTLQIASKP